MKIMDNYKKLARPVLISMLMVLVVVCCAVLQKILPATASIAAWLAWLTIMAGYVWVFWYATRDFWKSFSVKTRFLFTGGIALTGLLGSAAVIWYLGQEDTIRQYDSTVYWTHFINWNSQFFVDISTAFAELKKSLSAEYTLLPALLPTPLARLGDFQFTAFVLSNHWVYQIPAMLATAIFAERCIARTQNTALQAGRAFGMFVVCYLFGGPFVYLLDGYVDSVGLLWIALMLNVTFENPLKRFSIEQCLYLTLVSVLLLLSRRWYAFYIVGFYMAFGVEFVVRWVITRRFDRKYFSALCGMLITIAGLSSLCIVLLNPQVFTLFLANNYSEEYSAYKNRMLIQDLWNICQQLGFLTCAVSLWGTIWMSTRRGVRDVILRLVVASSVAVILFARIQSLTITHRSLLYPLVLISMALGTVALVQAAHGRKAQYAAVSVCAGLYICNTAIVFVPALQVLPAPIQCLFMQERWYPEKLESKQALVDCTTWLKQQTEGTNKTIYACGEGSLFSYELLRRSQMPEQLNTLPNMFASNIVDLRDGFPSQALLADYIVVLKPFASGFSQRQEVSWQVWQMVTGGEYTQVKEFPIDETKSICVYQAPEEGRYDRVKDLSDALRAIYPDKPFVYEPDWFTALAHFAPQTQYDYQTWTPHLVTAGEQVECELETSGQFNHLKFTVNCNQPETSLIVEVDGNEVASYTIENIQTVDVELDGAQSVRLLFQPPTDAQTVRVNFTETELS